MTNRRYTRDDAEHEGRHRVFFHTMKDGKVVENRPVAVQSIPAVGEYITFRMDGEWFLITRVLHCAVEDESRDFDAEVWLRQVDHLNLPDKATL